MEEKTKYHLQAILDNAIDNKKVFGTSFCLRYRDFHWCGISGNIDNDKQYFIASITKLFVTAVILHYRSLKLLSLDDKINNYLPQDIVRGLHVFKGKEYSGEITIKNLLAHTSGIPDYFQQKDSKSDSLEKTLMRGTDRKWGFEQAVERSMLLKPPFIPGTSGKAMYSDTNFQLLGQIIEGILGKAIAEVFDELIYDPLGLVKTYLYADISDKRPKTLYYKNKELHIPKAMASFGADGGIVSTSREMMIFLEAFFVGGFFPKEYIDELRAWNRIFFPMQSGIGIQRFKLPWFFNPTGAIPELIGHSGLSGAVAYHNSEKSLFVTGTVNQVAYPDTAIRLMIKLVRQVLK